MNETIGRDDEKLYVNDDLKAIAAETTIVLNGIKQLIINHPMVSDPFSGQASGELLCKEYARENNRQIIPLYPFTKARM